MTGMIPIPRRARDERTRCASFHRPQPLSLAPDPAKRGFTKAARECSMPWQFTWNQFTWNQITRNLFTWNLSAWNLSASLRPVLNRFVLPRPALFLAAFALCALCALVLGFPGSKALAAEKTAGQQMVHKQTYHKQLDHKLVDTRADASVPFMREEVYKEGDKEVRKEVRKNGQNRVTRPLRVICWEGGPYNEHVLLMQGLINELVRLGFAKDAPRPRTVENNIDVHWNWLSENAGSDSALKNAALKEDALKEDASRGEERDRKRDLLTFLKDGFYSANWDNRSREEVKKAIDERIRTVGDVDMIVVLDTNSLVDALSLELDIPVLAASITSIEALLASMQNGAAKDNYLVLNETDRIRRLVTLAHKQFAFKRLGVVFDSGPSGRDMAGMTQLEQAAREYGFNLVTCSTKIWGESTKNLLKNLNHCPDRLVKKGMDALYVTPTPLEEHAWNMTEVFEPLRNNRIPTISHRGHNEVMMGALVGPGSKEQKAHGARMANIMIRLAQGEDPKDIDTVCTAQSVLALNMQTAVRIGWDPPLSVLTLVEEYLNNDGIWIEADDAQWPDAQWPDAQ